MTVQEIRKILMKGNTGEYTHLIIYSDTFSHDIYSKYVKKGEDIESLIKKYNNCSKMSRIMEIYNYKLDLERQLNEARAYHIEPMEKIIKEDNPIIKYDKSISEGLKKAINYATRMHKGQKRLNGTPYITHPLHVVENVLKYKKSKSMDIISISACLHDTIEDTEATYYDIVKLFGPQVAGIVQELTTDEDMKNALGKQQYLSIKMKNMSSWALVIKLCDRLDNVKDLLNCSDKKFKNKYTNETIGIIDYLITNRKLSKTHISIIEQIIIILIQLSIGDVEKEQQLNIIIDKLKEQKQDLDLLSKFINIVSSIDESCNTNKIMQKKSIIQD